MYEKGGNEGTYYLWCLCDPFHLTILLLPLLESLLSLVPFSFVYVLFLFFFLPQDHESLLGLVLAVCCHGLHPRINCRHLHLMPVAVGPLPRHHFIVFHPPSVETLVHEQFPLVLLFVFQ